MIDEEQLEQLQRKVKQQKQQIVCLSIMVVCSFLLHLCYIISRWESRTDRYELHQMNMRVEQLKKDFQKIEEAIKLKVKNEQQERLAEETEYESDSTPN